MKFREKTVKEMLADVELEKTKVTDYAPKVIRGMEAELVERPMPNSSDVVVKSFLEMAEMIAKSMEAMATKCREQGEARGKEWDNAAGVARRKGEIQAREAGEYIDDLNRLRAISEKPVTSVEKTDGRGTVPDHSDN